MAGKPIPARVRKWRGQWYLFYFDYLTGKQVRKSCTKLNAHNSDQRKELEKHYRSVEQQQAAEVTILGTRLAGDARLIDDLEEYLKQRKADAEVRRENPEAREGISAATLQIIDTVIKHFIAWLKYNRKGRLLSKDLDAITLMKYRRYVAGQNTMLGERKVKRTSSTIQQYLRTLKTALSSINQLRPRRFHDFEAVVAPLKAIRGQRHLPTAFSPGELTSFLGAAIEREDEDRKALVERVKNGKKEVFEQSAPSTTATPVSRLFLLLALTGCRRGEALSLKWDDVDLERGKLVIRAMKTGRIRQLPLTRAAEGEVAPKFLKLMQSWRAEAPEAIYVLPHSGLTKPAFPKKAWDILVEGHDGKRIGPQKLRQNFTSYAASLGVPASVAALWQGHTTDVAEDHYRAQVMDRVKDAETFEDAMGLTPIIEKLIAGEK